MLYSHAESIHIMFASYFRPNQFLPQVTTHYLNSQKNIPIFDEQFNDGDVNPEHLFLKTRVSEDSFW